MGRATDAGIAHSPFVEGLRRTIHRIVYTTKGLESVHAQLRKIRNTRGHCPTNDAAPTAVARLAQYHQELAQYHQEKGLCAALLGRLR